MAGPLAGVRIIDMTSVMMGPFATQVLGDLGADVIKVEPPNGDTARWIGPSITPGMGPLFIHANRNKRSVVLDLKMKAGRDAFLRLAATVDVVVCNLRPQPLSRLGLRYEDVSAINPRIIHCSTFGFGEDGPYAGRPAYDDLIQGAVGIPSLFAKQGGEPRYIPLTSIDRMVALYAGNAILAALYHRERTGEGQSIEIAMYETMAHIVLSDHLYGHTFDPPLGEMGYPRTLAADRAPYQASDGYICAIIYSDQHWQRFCEAVVRPDLGCDARFSTVTNRVVNVVAFNQAVAEIMLTRSCDEWLALFAKADIPAAPLRTLETLVKDEHLRAVGQLIQVDHPSEGRINILKPSGCWSSTKPEIRRLPPQLGENGRQVLGEIGYSEAEIDTLVDNQVTVDPARPTGAE